MALTDFNGCALCDADSAGERWSDFGYWGECATSADGSFSFETYVPGMYTSRPSPHIHYKVWHNRRELLTSQFYFAQLGGADGRARHDARSELQTLSMTPEGKGRFTAQALVVV